MDENIFKSKVNLSQHLISFLQTGHKKIYFKDQVAEVTPQQSIFIEKGNCLMTELIIDDHIYFCKLFFVNDEDIERFLQKYYPNFSAKTNGKTSCFTIENDDYIRSFIHSLDLLASNDYHISTVKKEEILAYLSTKYGADFLQFLFALLENENIAFKTVIENHLYSPLNLKEIAFLCNMSISTFKRHFSNIYKESPGKFFKEKKLEKAKELLITNRKTAAEISEDLGYGNYSNFSSAFTKHFGVNPQKVKNEPFS